MLQYMPAPCKGIPSSHIDTVYLGRLQEVLFEDAKLRTHQQRAILGAAEVLGSSIGQLGSGVVDGFGLRQSR